VREAQTKERPGGKISAMAEKEADGKITKIAGEGWR